VFEGYEWAFKQMNIPYETADIIELDKYYNHSMSVALALSKALITSNEFTHVVIVGGLSLPEWFFSSMYDKDICFVATDDPHCTAPLLKTVKKYIKYYFSNEKTMEDEDSGIYYLPTATKDLRIHKGIDEIPDKFKSDVSFVGTMYPNRVDVLERVAAWCAENDKTLKIFGGYSKGSHTSPLIDKYLVSGTINNQASRLIYFGSKVNINIDRDVKWHANGINNNLFDTGKEAYSGNPRMYEVALSKGLQLFVDARQESKDIYGDNALHATIDSVEEVLDGAFKMQEGERVEKITNCFEEVMNNHLYIHRAVKLLNVIQGE
jgi:spore maturation protein CgeB